MTGVQTCALPICDLEAFMPISDVNKHIIAAVAGECIATALSIERVIAESTQQDVIAGPPQQDVVAVATVVKDFERPSVEGDAAPFRKSVERANDRITAAVVDDDKTVAARRRLGAAQDEVHTGEIDLPRDVELIVLRVDRCAADSDVQVVARRERERGGGHVRPRAAGASVTVKADGRAAAVDVAADGKIDPLPGCAEIGRAHV